MMTNLFNSLIFRISRAYLFVIGTIGQDVRDSMIRVRSSQRQCGLDGLVLRWSHVVPQRARPIPTTQCGGTEPHMTTYQTKRKETFLASFNIFFGHTSQPRVSKKKDVEFYENSE